MTVRGTRSANQMVAITTAREEKERRLGKPPFMQDRPADTRRKKQSWGKSLTAHRKDK